MSAFCAEVRKLEGKFHGIEFHHVVRDDNVGADVLSKLGSKRAEVPPGIFIQVLDKPTVAKEDEEALEPPKPSDGQVLVIEPDWRAEIIECIKSGKLPEPKSAGDKVHRRSKSFNLIGDQLYKHTASLGVLLKCIPRNEGIDLLKEIHSGSCTNHAASKTLVGKAFRSGFYWPTAKQDAGTIVRTCEGCQFFAKQQHLPASELQNIPVS